VESFTWFVFWLDMIPSTRFASCRLRLFRGFKVYFFGQNLHSSLGAITVFQLELEFNFNNP